MCFLKENFRASAESNSGSYKVSGGKTEMLKDVTASLCHLPRSPLMISTHLGGFTKFVGAIVLVSSSSRCLNLGLFSQFPYFPDLGFSPILRRHLGGLGQYLMGFALWLSALGRWCVNMMA